MKGRRVVQSRGSTIDLWVDTMRDEGLAEMGPEAMEGAERSDLWRARLKGLDQRDELGARGT